MHYERAASLGSTNAKMYLDYSRLLRASGKHAEAVEALKRATETDPNDGEARLELGYAYLADGSDEEALAQLQMVKGITGEQAFAYFHAMTYAYFRLDQQAEAEEAAATCRKYAKTPEEIERLNQLVAELNDTPRAPVLSPPGDTFDASPPRLRRREAFAVAEGTLQQVDCMAGKIRVWIGVGAEQMSFAILDPASVAVQEWRPSGFHLRAPKPAADQNRI